MKVVSIFTRDASAAAEPPTQEMMEQMGALIAEMREKGVLIETGGRDDEMLELRIARKHGSISVTDGPFTESKEVVGGFALLDVRDRDDLVAWTERFLSVTGDATCYIHEVGMAP